MLHYHVLYCRWENSLAPVIQLPEYNPDKLDNVILKEAPRKRFCKLSNVNIIGLEYCIYKLFSVSVGLDIPDYVTDDERPKHVQDIIKRLKEKHYLP